MSLPPCRSLPLREMEDVPDYCNPAVIRRNCLPPRTYYIPDTSHSLNGLWEFSYAATPAEAPTLTGSKSATSTETPPPIESEPTTWSPIQVPGHWQLQGHGIPHYTNVQYPFPVCPPFIPTANPTGTYRRAFSVPAQWDRDTQLRLRFDGVDSAYHLWVNGTLVGYAQGSRNPAEFDVSGLVNRDAINDVVVKVYQWCDGSYIEDQDQWWLSGIFRDVHLIAFPASARIEDWFLRTDLDSRYEDATVQASVHIHATASGTVEMALRDLPQHGGEVLGTATAHVSPDQSHYKMFIKVASPRKWNPETPNLYGVTITLDAGKPTRHIVRQKIGFRKIETLNGLITVNGAPVRLRGVNRHDHHPRFGRAVPLDFIRKDLLLMKRNNVNALRCAHYPSHPALYDIADELGLWVMDEADLECHGFYDAVARPKNVPEEMNYDQRKKLVFADAAKFTSDNPEWRAAYLDRMEQLVHRDKNHPSIIMWSLGNEAFYGQNHQSMYDWAKMIDPDRPIHYEGDAHAQSADMFSYMYPSAQRLLRLAKTEAVDESGNYDKPIVLCEYAHAMGNGPGGLLDYEHAFDTVPRLQGGFIWEWANHGLWKEHPDGKSYYAYGGDFGDYPHDGTFVMDGLTNSNHEPTPGLLEFKKVVQPVKLDLKDDKLIITNKYSYIDLGHLCATYKIESFGEKNRTLLSSGELPIPTALPSCAVSVDVSDMYAGVRPVEETYVTVTLTLRHSTSWAECGHEVAWSQHRLFERRKQSNLSHIVGKDAHSGLLVHKEGYMISIRGSAFSLDFNSAQGSICAWNVGGLDLFVKDPATGWAIAPGFWRPATDNDVHGSLPYWQRFGVDQMTSQLRSFNIDTKPNEVIVKTVVFLCPPVLAWGWVATTTYRIESTGRVWVLVHLLPTGSYPDHVPRAGLDIRLSPRLSSIEWFGLGPGESYPDKFAAQRTGIWAVNDVRDLQTPYDVPQENGNRMGTRWMRASCPQGLGFRVQASERVDGGAEKDTLFNFVASRNSTENISQGRHPCDLVESEAVLLRLDARTAGVGTAACGPGVREDLLVKTEEMRFGFIFDATN